MKFNRDEILKVIRSGAKPFITYDISKEEFIRNDLSPIKKFINEIKKIGTPLKQSCLLYTSAYDNVPE